VALSGDGSCRPDFWSLIPIDYLTYSVSNSYRDFSIRAPKRIVRSLHYAQTTHSQVIIRWLRAMVQPWPLLEVQPLTEANNDRESAVSLCFSAFSDCHCVWLISELLHLKLMFRFRHALFQDVDEWQQRSSMHIWTA